MRKLKKSIIEQGVVAPIFVWKDEENFILDGHQRLKVLNELQEEGYLIPDIPVAYIDAESIQDARQKLLYITSQYGDIQLDGLTEFVLDTGPELQLDNIRLTGGTLSLNKKERKRKPIECPHCGKEITFD